MRDTRAGWSRPTNHTLPSGPVVMPFGFVPGVSGGIMSMSPFDGSSDPSRSPSRTVNQMRPFADVMPVGFAFDGSELSNLVIAPVAGLMRAMCPGSPCSVAHMLPSGPWMICSGASPGDRPAVNSVIPMVAPLVTRPMAGRSLSVYHSLPSGPATMSVGVLNSVRPTAWMSTTPLGRMRPMPPPQAV